MHCSRLTTGFVRSVAIGSVAMAFVLGSHAVARTPANLTGFVTNAAGTGVTDASQQPTPRSGDDDSSGKANQRSLRGIVTSSIGGGIQGAQVVLRRGEQIAGETRTAADGSFGIDVEPGEYLVEVDAAGFARAVRTVRVSAGAPQVADFQLALSGFTEEIVVTANKIEEDPQKVPASVSVLSERAVAESRMLDFHTVHEYVPNLRSADFAGRGGFAYLTLRGQGNTFASVDPSATIYVDGVPYSDFYSYSQALYDVERIEVLRGPQSTLYGGFGQAGVVTVVVAALGRGSATNAMTLATLWLALVVLLPSMFNLVATTLHPVPSRVEMIQAIRVATPLPFLQSPSHAPSGAIGTHKSAALARPLSSRRAC